MTTKDYIYFALFAVLIGLVIYFNSCNKSDNSAYEKHLFEENAKLDSANKILEKAITILLVQNDSLRTTAGAHESNANEISHKINKRKNEIYNNPVDSNSANRVQLYLRKLANSYPK
jgi:hypothetical protein